MARLARATVALTATLAAAVGLSACGSGDAVASARASCVFVHHALALEHRSRAPGLSASRRTTLENSALATLLKGTPGAAQATSQDGSWNPLMTTINEAERVPFKDLEPTLRRMCRIADSKTPYL